MKYTHTIYTTTYPGQSFKWDSDTPISVDGNWVTVITPTKKILINVHNITTIETVTL